MKAYWWVSVGGESCEPAVVCGEGIFTLGCPDPHNPDQIALVKKMDAAPPTPAEAEAARAKWEREQRDVRHGYRVFR